MYKQRFVLSNVRLETRFEYDDCGQVISTYTDIAHLYIENGFIQGIYFGEIPQDYLTLEIYDAKQALALPGIEDAHIHLDKTYYGGPWRAAEQYKSVAEMIAIEKQLLPAQLPVMQQRAQAILDLIMEKGATKALAHCNVDHSIGTKHFERLQEVLQHNQQHISIKTVAFPQHGLLKDNAVELMKDVMQMGCNYVGGLDPQAIDGQLQLSLDTTLQLAIDYRAGIDLHLHERDAAGQRVLDYLFSQIEKNPELQHHVNISHGFVFYDLMRNGQLEDYAAQMKQLGIGLISAVPIQFRMPLAELRNLGVGVKIGTDSVMDHWYPFGQGDIIERCNVIAQLYGWHSELELSQALYFATGITPLDRHGQMQWPKIGMRADINLFQASCSAEVIARISPRVKTFYSGEDIK